MMEMQQQISRMGTDPAVKFAYWQKWTWETEDIPVGLMLAASVNGVSLTPEEIAAYDAPFLIRLQGGNPAMPSRVPDAAERPLGACSDGSLEGVLKVDEAVLCAFADNDPVTGAARRPFEARVPGAQGQPHKTIEGGGHFLQEGRGWELATIVADFIDSTPVG